MQAYVATWLILHWATRFHADAAQSQTWQEILPKTNMCGKSGAALLHYLKTRNLGHRLPRVNEEDSSIDTKVVNGNRTQIHLHPWQVVIFSPGNVIECGGSIISNYHVLTAAHCFVVKTTAEIDGVVYDVEKQVPFRDRIVGAGSAIARLTQAKFNISQLYYHKHFSNIHKRNDIALLKINGKFTWSSRVFPICLPSADQSYLPETMGTISGYGTDQRADGNDLGYLQMGTVYLTSRETCNVYDKVENTTLRDGMFCAAGYNKNYEIVDTCQGDSGGPLTYTKRHKTYLLGITSFGAGCGKEGYPGVYTKVSKYLNWIHERVEVSMGNGRAENLPPEIDVNN